MAHICFLRVGATPLFLRSGHGEFGGAEVRALTFARELARRHHQVDFAVGPHNELLDSTPEGIRVVGLPPRVRGVQKLVASLRGRLQLSPGAFPAMSQLSAPLIACFGVHRPTPEVVAAARATGKKTLLFLTSSEDADPTLNRRGSSKRARIQHNYAIRFADYIVAQTSSQCEHLERHFQRTATLIRNPIDTQVTEEELLEFRSHVLWVGRADNDSKRADLCFDLARRCPEVPFRVVMNGGNTELRASLLANKPDNVHVDSFVPLDQIEKLYQTAAVLINTSDSEGFPNAFLQAMKFRAPILSLNVDPDGVLTQQDCGDVAGSLPRMAELLAKYWPRAAWGVDKGKRGREYVTEHHELSNCVDQVETLMQRIEAEHHAAA